MFSKTTIFAFIVILLGAAFFTIKSVNQYKNNLKENHKIGILKAIDHLALNTTADGIQNILQNESYKILYESAQGDNSLAQQIVQKFVQQKVSAIVTIGTTVTQVAIQKTKNTPIIFASVTDPIESGIVKNPSEPEANVTGISNFAPDITEKQLAFFQKLIPNLKTIGVIYNSGESNSVELITKIKQAAEKLNLEVKETVAQNTNDAVFGAKSLLSSVQAIFIDNDNTALAATQGIVDSAMKVNVPVFCSDIDTIQYGVLAAVGPDQYKLGEKAGEMVIDIVKNGKKIKDIPIIYAEDIEYVVNKKTAEKLGVMIPANENIKIFK